MVHQRLGLLAYIAFRGAATGQRQRNATQGTQNYFGFIITLLLGSTAM